MNRDMPTISIIIPTHNRSASLLRTLDALRVQTYPLQQVEVLVVADGCSDGTVEGLRHYTAPFALYFIEQTNQGAAAARNHGAAYAKGQLLLFLDDDVEPTPPLIKSHVRAHQNRPSRVVIGPYPPVLQGRADFINIFMRTWSETKFLAMRQPSHRYTYRDLLSGNLSLEAELFTRLGGFDPAFRSCGGEDYEFGVRLIKAGVPFTFASDALCYHYNHETTDLDRLFERMRREGHSDVLIGLRHPELRPTLPIAHIEAYCASLRYIMRTLALTLAFRLPKAGDLLAIPLRRVLDLLERIRLRGPWLWLCRGLRGYWYCRGVVEELGTPKALNGFLRNNPNCANIDATESEIDLHDGLEVAEKRLDEERPAGVRIRYRQQSVGRIPPQPGAERLRGVHLRRILATDFAKPLLKALAVEGTTNEFINADHLLADFKRAVLCSTHAGDVTDHALYLERPNKKHIQKNQLI